MKFSTIIKCTALSALLLICLASFGCKTDTQDSKPTAVPNSTQASGNIQDNNSPSASEEATETPAPTKAPEISKASFDPSTINAGDRVSVFTVTSKEAQDDGSTVIVFQGTLTVNGTLTKTDEEACIFVCTDEYTHTLPVPTGTALSKGISLSALTAEAMLGATDGAFSITIHDYSLVITDTEVLATVSVFEKAKTEHTVIG